MSDKTNNTGKIWNIYLSGEIHSDWRNEIINGAESANLPAIFSSPVLDHSSSDTCGVAILGGEEKPFWKDHKGAKVNAIRTRTLLAEADIVIVCFGEKYRQWNAAFEAGAAVALGKALIVIHPEEFTHALKEVDAQALAVCQKPEQAIELLRYVISS